MKGIFHIKLDDGWFICNMDTGKWVISSTKEIPKEALSYINEPFKKYPYVGTKLLVLNITTRCNLDCIYCHTNKKISKDMDFYIAKEAIDKAMAFDNRIKIVFHGSEPLMNFSLIKKVVTYGKKRYPYIKFSLQSNGTLLSDYILDFLQRYKVGIGISIDGTKNYHTIQRPYKNGVSSYSNVINAIRKINKYQKVNVITVVTKYNVNHLNEIVNHYNSIGGIEEVLFSPIVPTSDEKKLLVPRTEDLIKNMVSVIEEYFENIIKNNSSVKIVNARHIFGNLFSKKLTDTCLKCGLSNIHPLLAIDVNGDVYPCDFFWGNERFKIGNIMHNSLEEIINSPKNFRVWRNIKKESECNNCKWKRFCGGGCMGELLNLESKKSIYCEYYKGIFEWAVKKIPYLHEKKILGKILS